MHWSKRMLYYKPRTIYQSTAVFVCLQCLTTYNGFWYKRGRFIANRWTKLYTAIMPLVVFVLLAFCLAKLLADPHDRRFIFAMDKLALFICALELFMTMLGLVLCSYSMSRHVRQHIELYDRLQCMDLKLMRDFGANLNYHKLFWKNVMELSPLFFICLVAIFWSVHLLAPHSAGYCYGAAVLYLFSICGAYSISFAHSNFAEMLRLRFRLIQKLLNVDYLRKFYPQQQVCEQRVRQLVEMVRSLHEMIDAINSIFIVSLLFDLTHDFTLVTTELYLLFGHSLGASVDVKFFIYNALWLSLPFYKILVKPMGCQRTVEEFKNCLRLIKRIDIWFPNFETSKLIVESTIHWRLENGIEFVCGFNLIYNKTIILTITAVIFNYLLILIQFRMTQLMGKEIEEKKDALQDWIGEL